MSVSQTSITIECNVRTLDSFHLPPNAPRRLDNSEYSRNGDYYPSRLEAQQLALDTILTFRLQAPDNRVGLAASAGAGVEVLHTGSNLDTEVKDAMDAAHMSPSGVARPL